VGALPQLTRAARAALLVGLASLAAAGASSLLARLVPLPKRLTATDSVSVEYRDGTPLHVFLSADDKWRLPVSVADVDPEYVRALLRLEDRRFQLHVGVDPLAVLRAAAQNLASGRVVSGASTLSMQLARLASPRPRTLGAKLIEALRALQIELRLSKQEVLEAYLRLAPYGRNVEGVQAASLAYFGHRASALSEAEICTLLAVPQAPSRRFPRPRNAERLRRARDRIAERIYPPAVAERVRSVAPPERVRPFPRAAPHAARWLRTHQRGRARLRSTLDREAQQQAELLLGGSRQELAWSGIHNAAVVVADHRSAEVRALIGNFDFEDARHGGQIPAFVQPRSPGSLLKPYLYALAMERGLASPEHLVRDDPARWGTYAPTNFDGRWSGLVRLEDALSRSLNVPFVRLLAQVGVESFLGLLRQGGLRHLDPDPGHYGLSAAVGGVELTPLEATALFATLAQDGRYRPLRLLVGEPAVAGPLVVFSPGAAWLTRRALARRDRPDFPTHSGGRGAGARGVHWKTGTSFGHRDAWAAGSDPTHTAVVWLGNLDGTPSSALVGADAVGPLLFDLLSGLRPSGSHEADVRPRDLADLEVCAESGHLATSACPKRDRVWALAAAVPVVACPYHVLVDVDTESGLALTPECRRGHRYEARPFVVWPAGVRRWLSGRHRRLALAPAYAPGCVPAASTEPPRITSPPPGHSVMLLPGLPTARQEVPLEAETAASGTVSWFVDGEYLGSVDPAERLWWRPVPGQHRIRVVDEAGQAGTRELTVRAGP